ncbi:MAG: response regulator [Pseudomonadota bacterium]
MTTPRIMVVEDERIVALHIRQQLEKLGYEVPSVVSSGEQALMKIDQERPDLVLMDIRIEGSIDGIETAGRIPPEYNIPVVYLTAHSEEATLARARATKPHGYLLKPFSERELHATIQMAMERRDAEVSRLAQDEQQHQTQKLEAIGQLAGGVAHDFNNLLAIIHGNLELIQERTVTYETGEMITDAMKATQRGTTLTQQLLAYSRRQPLMPEVIELSPLITELSGLLQRLLGETIKVETALPEQMWKIQVDQNQLESALFNLAINSRDAMPDGGVLRIEVVNADLRGSTAHLQGEIPPGLYTVISVSDNGFGMTEDVTKKAMEPFFTTKPPGKGTGLGLSQVFGFVRQSQGGMQIRSRVLEGTTVELYFPAAEGQATNIKLRPGLYDLPMAAPEECVLLVEDDTTVRKLVSKILTSLGYRTLEAEDGYDACRILEAEGRIDLLITDLILPKGMNGAVLAKKSRDMRPKIKVLFMSGYPASTVQQAGDSGAAVELIQKPFTKMAFANKIKSVLRDR